MSLDLKIRKKYCSSSKDIDRLSNSYTTCIVAPKPKQKDGPLDEDELPSPTRDCIFKAMFAQEATKNFAGLLLSGILDMPYEKIISKAHLSNNELVHRTSDKISRIDLALKIENMYIDIEMNNSVMTKRNNNYAYLLYGSGVKYPDKAKEKEFNPVIQVNLNNYTTKGINKPLVVHYESYKNILRVPIIFIDIYLPLVMSFCDEAGIENVDKTLGYIRVMFETSKKRAYELVSKVNHKEVLLEYLKMLESLKGDKEVMKKYDEESDTYVAGKEVGREEGREEGRQEGREEGTIKTAINMLKDGVKPTLVQKYTNLSLKKIKSLQMNLW